MSISPRKCGGMTDEEELETDDPVEIAYSTIIFPIKIYKRLRHNSGHRQKKKAAAGSFSIIAEDCSNKRHLC